MVLLANTVLWPIWNIYSQKVLSIYLHLEGTLWQEACFNPILCVKCIMQSYVLPVCDFQYDLIQFMKFNNMISTHVGDKQLIQGNRWEDSRKSLAEIQRSSWKGLVEGGNGMDEEKEWNEEWNTRWKTWRYTGWWGEKGNAWRASQSCEREGEGVLSREGGREQGVKRRGKRGGGCCFKISTDECVLSLWGEDLLPFSVCHSTRLCWAREGDGRLKARVFGLRILSTWGFQKCWSEFGNRRCAFVPISVGNMHFTILACSLCLIARVLL